MENDIREIGQPLSQSSFWMKLVGVLMIIYGVLTALSIVGIIIAWLPIWMGVVLFQSASAATEAAQSGDKDTLVRSLAKLKTYFTIMGITTLIGLVLAIGAFLMGGIGAMLQMQGGGHF